MEFVVGNTLFVMAHEMGHVVIYEMNMPVLGREEDAADSFAVLIALHMRSAFSERVLIEAAKGWVLSSYRDKKAGNALAFYDEHGLDLQRAYNVVCMMVGSDPEKYKTLATETKLPEERQKSCVRDYRTAAWSWEEMLKPHRRSADQPKVTIKVEYKDDEKYAVQAKDPAPHGRARSLRRRMRRIVSRGPIRSRWWRAHAGNRMPRWNVGTRTLTLCYELVERIH